jgi:hypothetical protein
MVSKERTTGRFTFTISWRHINSPRWCTEIQNYLYFSFFWISRRKLYIPFTNLNDFCTAAALVSEYSCSVCWKRALKILWRIDPLLGNDSVNTFPREPTSATTGRLLLDNGSVNTSKNTGQQKTAFSMGSAPRLYNENFQKSRQLLSRARSSSGDGSWRWWIRNG